VAPGRPAAAGRHPPGVIDRLAFDGNDWWLLDYKSSRPAPGEDWETFITQETAKYRPQLLAYREMAAKARKLNPRRPSGWEFILLPAAKWWRFKVVGY